MNNISWPGWETVRVIGRGSFGTVYEIQRSSYGFTEKAALKAISIPLDEAEVEYLRVTGLGDQDITQAFHAQVGDITREYHLMAGMRDNPNIVHIDDFQALQHEDGLGWDVLFKMELLTPLMKALDKVKTEDHVLHLAKDLCNALIACHSKNVVHRDIKPQNVFISENGTFKLGDFGIARTMERTTRATARIGTYAYMAPEVAKAESYGKTADICSLGLLLYWLLNERRGPFMPLPPIVPKYTDEEQANHRRLAGEAFPPPVNGSKKLKRIVMKACAFDPKDRYASAEEMLSALEGKEPLSVAPAKPEASVDPVTPVAPVKPIEPEKPVAPAKPVDPKEDERSRREAEILQKAQEYQAKRRKEQEERERLRQQDEAKRKELLKQKIEQAQQVQQKKDQLTLCILFSAISAVFSFMIYYSADAHQSEGQILFLISVVLGVIFIGLRLGLKDPSE